MRDYYDIAVLGYAGADEVRSLLDADRDLIPVTELATIRPAVRTETVEHRLPDGSIALREIPAPAWVEPRAAGQTPMCEALRRARDLVAAWCARPEHAESFPPVVFNITDGEATDCDEGGAARRRRPDPRAAHDRRPCAAGQHAHRRRRLGPHGVPPPAREEAAACPNRYAKLLWECSSELPAAFEAAAREAKGPGALPPFRGMSFNASAAELVTMLNIGSVSVKTE